MTGLASIRDADYVTDWTEWKNAEGSMEGSCAFRAISDRARSLFKTYGADESNIFEVPGEATYEIFDHLDALGFGEF